MTLVESIQSRAAILPPHAQEALLNYADFLSQKYSSNGHAEEDEYYSPELIQMLQDRYERYKANPETGVDFEALKSEVYKEHGWKQ